jgi:hypothetical protein
VTAVRTYVKARCGACGALVAELVGDPGATTPEQVGAGARWEDPDEWLREIARRQRPPADHLVPVRRCEHPAELPSPAHAALRRHLRRSLDRGRAVTIRVPLPGVAGQLL